MASVDRAGDTLSGPAGNLDIHVEISQLKRPEPGTHHTQNISRLGIKSHESPARSLRDQLKLNRDGGLGLRDQCLLVEHERLKRFNPVVLIHRDLTLMNRYFKDSE
jgi:hypothetical protein